MSEPAVIHNTFVIDRAYPAAPDRVFAAFADPSKKRRWLIGGNHVVEHFEMNFEIGGKELTTFRIKEGGPMQGVTFSSATTYCDIVAGQRIVFASTMSMNGKCFSASLVTVELLPSANGTEVVFTHQAAYFEGADGPAMREDGWGKILDRLSAEFPPQ